MKKLALALVFALSMFSVIGCGGSSPTTPAKATTPPTTKTP